MNNNSNHCNVKRKFNSFLLISFCVSIFLLIITILLIDEEKSMFTLSLRQQIKHTVPLDKIVSGGPSQDENTIN